MTARVERQRCPGCRRRFGGAEAYRVAHTTQGRCKTVTELRRNRLHRREDGVWVQTHQRVVYRQLRLFRPGRPRPLAYARSATSGRGDRALRSAPEGTTTNRQGVQVTLPPPIGEAA